MNALKTRRWAQFTFTQALVVFLAVAFAAAWIHNRAERRRLQEALNAAQADLQFRELEMKMMNAMAKRDRELHAWKLANATGNTTAESAARSRYFKRWSEVQAALRELYDTEVGRFIDFDYQLGGPIPRLADK